MTAAVPGPDPPGSAATVFLDALRHRFHDALDPFSGRVEWVAGGVDRDGCAVVLYREHSGGPVLGRRYDLGRFAAMFLPPPSIQELADIAFVEEITDPTGPGARLHVDWATGLIPDAFAVEWVGETWISPAG